MSDLSDARFPEGATRREFVKLGLIGGAAAAGALGPLAGLASAAGSAADAATGTVVTWSPDTRPDALKSEKWWDSAFIKANPGVKVKQLTVPYGKDNVKLKAGQKTGVLPDIIWAYSDFLYSYGQSGQTRAVGDIVARIGRKRFLPAA